MELKKVWRRVLLGALVATMAVALGAGISLAAPTYSIKGSVSRGTTDYATWLASSVYAELYTKTYDDASAAWVWTSTGTKVNVSLADGSFSIDGLAPGNYKVGFGDTNGKYAPVYYLNAATAADGTTLTIDTTGVVLASPQALTTAPVVAAPTATISGTVHATDNTDWADANISAVAYAQRVVWVQSTKTWTLAWTPVASSQVATDGTYAITDLSTDATGVCEMWNDTTETADATWLETITVGPNFSLVRSVNGTNRSAINTYKANWNDYKIQFVDSGNVYSSLYYNQAVAQSAATTITSLSSDQKGIDATLSPDPNSHKFSGTVNFVGATPVLGDVYVSVYAQDAAGNWAATGTANVATSGAWVVHVLASTIPTDVKVGFQDGESVFGQTFYGATSTQTLDFASLVNINSGNLNPSGINATMTAQASTVTAGTDPIDTAVQVSMKKFSSANTVVIASADDWTYEVAAGPYAEMMHEPLLLIHKSSVPDAVMSELDRLGATEAVIIGGPKAIAYSVEDDLHGSGILVTRRLENADASGTSASVAQELMARGVYGAGEDGKLMGIVAVGMKTPYEAMCAAPIAAAKAMPILLVGNKSIAQPVQDFLDSFESDGTNVLVVGGTNNINDDVASQLTPVSADSDPDAFANILTRISVDKNDFAAESVAVAQYAMDNYGFSGRMVTLTTSKDAAEALALAPVIAESNAPLLVTNPLLKKVYVNGTRPRLYTYLNRPIEEYLTSVTDATGAYPLDPDASYTHNPNIAVINAVGQMDSKVLARALSFLNN